MAISVKDVEHIGSLACIELSEQEKERFAKQFNSILDYFKELDGLNTENVEPTYHVIGLTNVFREDIADESAANIVFEEGSGKPIAEAGLNLPWDAIWVIGCDPHCSVTEIFDDLCASRGRAYEPYRVNETAGRAR